MDALTLSNSDVNVTATDLTALAINGPPSI